MSPNLSLSLDEIRILETILAPLSKRAQQPLSLGGLIEKWSDFVVRVEQGYQYSIYEYTNDLSTRDLLEHVVLNAPQPLREKIVAEVRVWDDRFRDTTLEYGKPLVSPVFHELAWWWSRVPKILEGELKTDFQVEGISS
jgi:hypothetical protein